ncbi:MAG: PBP1A family penicillin-binding protein [Acidobacteria bacterium]|nr:PBP1A family penicillin-binding protein [Acidobacteriota bacterium]
MPVNSVFSRSELDNSRKNKPAVVQRFFRKSTFLAVLLLSALAGSLTGLAVAYQSSLAGQDWGVAELASYQPWGITQVYASDGKSVIGEFALERRIPLSYDEIPPHMRHAILAIEDARFEKHLGVDPIGIARALVKNTLAGRTVEGGSTLTQQLSKMLFLTDERTYTRKIKEAILSLQIEREFSKHQIFELYANQINLGGGAYGVEAGAQYYFGKSAKDLTIEECATLAAIPKAPSNYSPALNPEKSLNRRNLVINGMVEEGFISAAEGEAAKSKPIKLNLTPRETNTSGPYAFFVEEVRRELENKFGSRETHSLGYKVITTVDAEAQIRAVQAVRAGLHSYAQRHGSKWRGELDNIFDQGVKDINKYKHPEWSLTLAEGMYVYGLITEVNSRDARVSFGDYHAVVTEKEIAIAGQAPSKVFKVGDLAVFQIKKMNQPDKDKEEEKKEAKPKTESGSEKETKKKPKTEPQGDPFELSVELQVVPKVTGALLCIETKTGEVTAMVGGYDFSISRFNNATQGNRQTGSAFKPFVYAAAVENGWKPESLVLDSPFTQGNWSPRNYDGTFSGAIPLSTALAKSRNIPAVRLLKSVGIPKGTEMVKRFGITNPMAPFLPSALGATEVPLVEMVSAYSVFPNKGTRARPHYIRRVTDRNGITIYDYANDEKQQVFKVLSPYVAGQMVSLMRGVVESGTAAAIKGVTQGDLNKREIGGKTGTVNDYTDAWFIGYTPSVACGCWIGHQGEKRSLGEGETGGSAALPMWTKFMGFYMKGKPIEKFGEVPPPDEKTKSMIAARTREAQKELEKMAEESAIDTGADLAKEAIMGDGDSEAPPKPSKPKDPAKSGTDDKKKPTAGDDKKKPPTTTGADKKKPPTSTGWVKPGDKPPAAKPKKPNP